MVLKVLLKFPPTLVLVHRWLFPVLGGKTYRAILGGGGKRTIERALQNQFWRPQKVGFAWSVPVSSKENNRAKTNGGGGGNVS